MPSDWTGIKAVSYIGKYIESKRDSITFEGPGRKVVTWAANRKSMEALRGSKVIPKYVSVRVEISDGKKPSATNPPRNVTVTPASSEGCRCADNPPLPCVRCTGGCTYGACMVLDGSCSCVER